MDNKSGLTIVALGLIFAGIIVMYTAFYNPSVIVRSPQDNQSDNQIADSQTSVQTQTQATASTTIAPTASADEASISYPININTATANELSCGIPGIGDVIASRIVEYRELYGCYSSVDDLMIISGISENKLESIRQYLTV